MKHYRAHFDGTKVVFDEPVRIFPNTILEVVVPDTEQDARRLGEAVFLASLPVLQSIWDNPKDAEYDSLK